MRLLAIDTATEACSVAFWHDGQTVSRFESAGRTHTQRLLPMVQALMAEAGCAFSQLDGLVCGVGPGSFAGVRIGVGYVKGLALALDRPVLGVSSLAMLAQAAIESGATQVLACIDARMNEVYWGSFERDADGLARASGAARVAAPEAVRETRAGPWHAVGTGWATYGEVLRAQVDAAIAQVDGTALPHAQCALRLARPRFEQGLGIRADALEPLYLRDKVALTLEEQARLRQAKT
jgi:tRNA threonylcarbamoyladenosine biosynthesis protein TsaB